MSPEHLQSRHSGGRGYGAPADVWALGVALYVMLTGNFPFGHRVSARDTLQMFHAIQNETIEYPAWLSEGAVGMLKGLLNRDVLKRFTISEIKSHPWMRETHWAQVREDSAREVPQEDVLELMDEHKISMIEDNVGSSETSKCLEDVVSSVSGCSSESTARRKQGVPGFELLGFGFLNV